MRKFIIAGALIATLGIAACGGDSGGSTKPDAAPTRPDPVARAETLLLSQFDREPYLTSLSRVVFDMTILAETVHADFSDDYYDGLAYDQEHPETISHEVSCVSAGSNAFTCTHKLQGKVYGQRTTLRVVVSPSSDRAVIEWERDSSGKSFPG